jgi:hypothetical protein
VVVDLTVDVGNGPVSVNEHLACDLGVFWLVRCPKVVTAEGAEDQNRCEDQDEVFAFQVGPPGSVSERTRVSPDVSLTG